jgi:hypothetical protein
MPPDLHRAVANIREAGIAAAAWSEALRSLTDAIGVAGAACIISNKKTGRVEWTCFSGLSAEFEPAYVNYYARLDTFAPLLNGCLDWMKLSESLSAPLLRRSEWYNDFVLGCGVRDILGVRLVDTPSHFAIFGLHQRIGRSFDDKTLSILKNVEQPLASSMLRHVENLPGFTSETPAPKLSSRGARYYFHVGHSRNYPDETGSVFSSREGAVAHARVLAAELGQDQDWAGFLVSVTDADGREVAQIPVGPQRK